MKHTVKDIRYITPPTIPPNIDFEPKYDQELVQAIFKLAHQYPVSCLTKAGRRRQGLRNQAKRLMSCGERFMKFTCDTCESDFYAPTRCETRICKECARKYAARLRQKQNELINRLQPKHGKKLMFLTVTKRSVPGESLSSADIRILNKNFRKLVNKLYPKRRGCGAFSVLESGKNWNWHIHAVVYGNYIAQSTISEAWKKATGDSSIVDIRAVRNPQKALNYLLKYVAKPPEFRSHEDTAKYLDLLLGVRRIHTYGIFYNFKFYVKSSCDCFHCGSSIYVSGMVWLIDLPEDYVTFEMARKQTTLN